MRFTFKNRSQTGAIILPLSPSVTLRPGGSRVFDLPASSVDVEAIHQLVDAKLLFVSSADDPGVPDDIEVPVAAANGLYAQMAIMPSGATPQVDFQAAEVYTSTISENTAITLSTPVLDKVITLVVDGNFTFAMPGSVTVLGGGTYDGATTNYIYIHCIDAVTPAYIATINQA